MSLPAIVEDFLELAVLPSNSRQERILADALRAKLTALGLTVEEDGTGPLIQGEAGNLIARLPGDPRIPAIMFSAHLDRVANHGHIQPIMAEDGAVIRSDGTSILGADDVSGLCAILDGLRRVRAEGLPHGEIEVVLSVAEEVGLQGALHLDYDRIKSKMAYVIDTGGPVGTLVNQAPTQYTLAVKVRGRSAHAGMEPEKGLSAIRVAAAALTRLREGRLSPYTTANFGCFQAGLATNIVCDFALVKGEARSSRPEELAAYLEEVDRVFQEVAAEYQTDISVERHLEYETFRVDEIETVIQLAGRAMASLGLPLSVVATGGGMDGNHFNHHGIKAVGLSPGYVGVHTSKEEQPVAQLIQCGQLVAGIIKESASLARDS
ncbi:MAG: M20/M25/M40 family metallo-hydrolase [Candidatus Adiutrix sp.]|jgi:tripeptide aminopeptidase|nr:M20/M25/M40 family metallo-hydrolase [Candidatus Adiutrix sp.]